MRKSVTVMGCILGLGLALLARPAAAQTSTATKKAPAAQTSKAPASTAKKPATTAAKPAEKAAVTELKDQKAKLSYALGMSLGNNLHQNDIEVDPAIVAQALADAFAGKKLLMTEDDMRAALAQLNKDVRAKQEEKRKQLAENNKKEGEAFLAANKTKEGVVALPSGLQYKIVTAGTGPKPTATDTVVCNYKGTLIDGKEFDSSYKRGEPATFPVGGVIKGWTEALQLMPVGSKWQLFIPSEMAYAERGAGPDIGPNATLIFEVELISIKEPPKPPEPATLDSIKPPEPKKDAPKAPEPKKDAPKPPDPKN